MAEFRLTARPALGGLNAEIGATTLREIDGARLTIVSIPHGADAAMQIAIELHFECALPAPGTSTLSAPTGARLLGLGSDRLMVLQLPDAAQAPLTPLPGYRVDQSDHWVILDLAGALCLRSLERTCRLDLDPAAFSRGDLARTPIEGVSCILLRLDLDRFLLMAPRSYAAALAHTLTTSLTYIA